MDNAHTAVTPLPCPFCGSERAYLDCMSRDDQEVCIEMSPACIDCGATILQTRMTTQEAIAAWNTRATTADLQARLDACEARNAELVEALEGLLNADSRNRRNIWEPRAEELLATTRNADAKGGGA